MDRFFVAIVGLLALPLLGACGFAPLYGRADGQPSPVAAELAQIAIAPIADRRGQLLRNALEERLTPSGDPPQAGYTLTVKLDETIEKLGIRQDASPTIANLTLKASYHLRASGAPKDALAGSARSVISYSIAFADFPTVVAEGDARARAVRELASEITARLASHFSQTARKPL